LAFGVRVKLKTADFQILTRQHRLARPTDVAEELYSVALALLDEFDHAGPFRLVGMAAYDLEQEADAAQPDLFAGGARRRKLEVAVDALSQRFGAGIVRHADDLSRRPRVAPNLDFLDEGDE
jgi:DNA polymerase-4